MITDKLSVEQPTVDEITPKELADLQAEMLLHLLDIEIALDRLTPEGRRYTMKLRIESLTEFINEQVGHSLPRVRGQLPDDQ